MEILSLVVSVIFIILLFSILASSVQEILSNWLSLRGAILMRAIHNLFEGPEMKKLYASWVQSSDFGFLLKQSSQNIFGRFFDNLAKQVRLILGVEIPVPKGIDKNRKDRLELPPSYISSDAFLLMLENINLDDSFLEKMDDSFLKKLLIRVKNVQHKPEELKVEFDKWYTEIMGRVTEAYKRHTQLMVFFIGLTLAVVFNANMITLFKGLYKAPEEKSEIYNMAMNYVAQNDTLQIQPVVTDTSQANSALPKFDSVIFVPVKDLLQFKSLGLKDPKDTSVYTMAGIRKNIVGWFFMAIAISFGAPFWFDLLKKIINYKK